jgi:hypothetical protein
VVVAVHVTHARLQRGDGRRRVLLVLRRSREKGGAPSGWRRRCRRFDNASDVVETTSARACFTRTSCAGMTRASSPETRHARRAAEPAPASKSRASGPSPARHDVPAMLFPPSTFRGPHGLFGLQFRERVAESQSRRTTAIFSTRPKPRRAR